MGTVTWTAPGTLTSALATELNSLANGSYSAASGAIDNTTARDRYIDLELALASLTPSGTPSCSVFLLVAVDGTPTYEDGGGSTAPQGAPIAVFGPINTGAAAKRVGRYSIPIPPFNFKLVLLNNTGVALAASGSTLKYRTHSETVA